MTTRRVVLAPNELAAVEAGTSLPARSVHHLTRVLRLHTGASIELGDGDGRVVAGRLRLEKRDGYGDALVELPSEPAGPRTVLIVPPLKAPRFRFVLEKAVELGATDILPVLSARTSVRPRAMQAVKWETKWRDAVREAGQQCRRAYLPQVATIRSLEDVWASASDWPGIRILGSTRQDTQRWPEGTGGPCVILVGPEGGFTAEEETRALAEGFLPVTLGLFPVRAETAALALLTLAADRAARQDSPCH